MDEMKWMLIVWSACSLLFAGIGVYDLFSEKQVGFWANFKEPATRDVRGYNRAVGLLFLTFAAVFEVIGILAYSVGDSPLLFLTILLVSAEVIVLLLVYMKIERSYKK